MTTDIIPILHVSDAQSAVDWYRRLGFDKTFAHRFEPHLPAYVGIRRDGSQIHLSEHAGDARPNTLFYVWVDDIDDIATEFATTVEETPWGREVSLTDPDGNRIRCAAPIPSDGTDAVLGDGVVASLLELESAMWEDGTRGDRRWMADQLTASFTEFGWSGRVYTRQDILDLDVGPMEASLDQLEVRALGRDAALVTYRSQQPRGSGNRASVWVRELGRWALEFHQGTPVD